MKKSKIIMVLVFLLVIGGISILSFAAKDKAFSENENRYLAERPVLTWDRIVSGDFQNDLETYLNDHIIFRDQWITMKTAVQKASGDTDIGGAYVGKDGYDFEKIIPEDIDEKLVDRNIDAVQRYFSYCSNTIPREKLSFLLVPTSGLIKSEYLPAHAILFDQSAYIVRVQEAMQDYNYIDVESALIEDADEYVYYRTDHHWTTQGAFLAYEEWCGATGHAFLGADAYEAVQVTDSFRGSLYSKILDCDSAYDSIWIMNPKDSDASYTVMADGEDIGGFYQEEKLAEKDKYTYFFGGNYGEVCIERSRTGEEDVQEEKNLLVIKDSFANTFVPLIAEEYDHIYMVDLRYYAGDMTAYLEENEITDVLVLYNIANFVSDKNIFKLSSNIAKAE